MDLDDIHDRILDETDYIQKLRQDGYPQYTRRESRQAVNSVEDEKDVEMLRELQEGKSLVDLSYSGLGGMLERLEDGGMIERPETGDEYLELTRLSHTYLHYHDRIEESGF